MMKNSNCSGGCNVIDRRSLLTRTAPACAAACIGLGRFPGAFEPAGGRASQEQHKFDVPREISMSSRQRALMMYRGMIPVVQELRPYSVLVHPAWVAATAAYFKDMDAMGPDGAPGGGK